MNAYRRTSAALLALISLTAHCGHEPVSTDGGGSSDGGAPPDLQAPICQDGGSPAPDGAPFSCDPGSNGDGGENPTCFGRGECLVSLSESHQQQNGYNGCVPIYEPSNYPFATASYTCGTPGTGNAGDSCSDASCSSGLVCSDVGALPGQRTCRPLCDSINVCMATNQLCARVGLPHCAPACTPYGGDCPNGLNCGLILDGVLPVNVNSIIVMTCKVVGTTPLGSHCAYDTDCGANMVCWFNACREICSNAHACASGTCKPLGFSQPDVGYCQP